MTQNRIGELIRPAAPSQATGFVLVAADTLPAPIAAATAARHDLYRLAYEQAMEAVASARRLRRWIFRAAQTRSTN
jgi:hypothetical protein